MKVIAKAVGVALVSAALLQGASGQDSTFPNRPISIVVPYTPGGISDGVTREFARFLSEELHQPVLVLNKPGAGGIVGTEFVAAAKGDGYTLLYGAPGPILITPSLQKKLSYDPMKSFAPVHGFFDSPMILLANAARPYKSVEQLIEHARRNPGAINYGSPGIGTTPHLAAEALRRAAKIDLVHIAYKGAPMADLVAGVIDIAFNYSVGSAPLIEAGKIVPLAVTGSQRMSTFPDVPTFKELGLDAVTVTGPSVILAPSSTPEEILSKLEIAANAALAKPALKKFVEADGSIVMSDLRRSAARDYMKQQIEHFGRLIQESGIAPE